MLFRRSLFVLRHQPRKESWKNGQPSDLKAIRRQLLKQLGQDIPVLCLPADVALFVFDIEEGDIEEGDIEEEEEPPRAKA